MFTFWELWSFDLGLRTIFFICGTGIRYIRSLRSYKVVLLIRYIICCNTLIYPFFWCTSRVNYFFCVKWFRLWERTIVVILLILIFPWRSFIIFRKYFFVVDCSITTIWLLKRGRHQIYVHSESLCIQPWIVGFTTIILHSRNPTNPVFPRSEYLP